MIGDDMMTSVIPTHSKVLPVPGVPDAEIHEVSSLPLALEGSARVGGFSVARPGALLHTVPKVARYLITNGKLIEYVRETGSHPLDVEQFLYGSARAALVHQRGGLPLHSACLRAPENDFAVAITGQSGAGKSTLATELIRRGWKLLGDDVTPIYSGPGGVMAWPSLGSVKLWRDACDRFTLDTASLQHLPGGRDKYLLPVEASEGPVRLSYIFLLDRKQSTGISLVHGPAKLALLMENTYKAQYLSGLGCIPSHFKISCDIAVEVTIAALCCSGPVNESAVLLSSFCGL